MAVTQYCNYNFNSFCKIGDKHYGATDDGIFELVGDTDAGEDIDAWFELPISDFGISNVKRLRRIYLGYEATGDLTIKVKDNEDNERPYPLDNIASDKQVGGEVTIERDQLGRYWGLRVDNVRGAYFAVDSIEVVPVILGRKPR
jgi:hypothetical protein